MDTLHTPASGTGQLTPQDHVYNHNPNEYKQLLNEKPWTKDPRYFTNVKISALALMKMTTHAQSGGDIEVMGIMQGRVQNHTLVVLDAFALPVEGTETRVNAQDEAYEYMVQHLTLAKEAGRLEHAIGWYHSHPGYGCWLSGIDVNTQLLNQQYQDPWLAVVIDPKRTSSTGKVDLGAFRTLPKDHQPPKEAGTTVSNVPAEKLGDFGVHCNQYYALPVSFFQSSLDTALLDKLWQKQWTHTVTSATLPVDPSHLTDQIMDLAKKVDQLRQPTDNNTSENSPSTSEQGESSEKPTESPTAAVVREASVMGNESLQGLAAQVIQSALFQPPTSEY
ncbi:COP9 signalosome complex subunit 5 [Dispira parvispora]|uniref:COP9 signalosome complex subunit 5 n=1 Tax=Dispira parvispora TaxID=1520584 RepID=A0A9W8AXI3_9FUNG|nr:COP9 signalosome complex subunit 5 [Dispira parvispora]